MLVLLDLISVSPVHPDIGKRHSIKTINGGTSWGTIQNELTKVTILSLAIDPSNNQVIYAGTSIRGILKSSDGGVSWSTINTGLTFPVVNSLSISNTNSHIVYAGTWGGGIFRIARPKPIDAVCGGANGRSLTSAPTNTSPNPSGFLCNDDSSPTVSGSGPWTWTCLGTNGGNDSNCSASILQRNLDITVSGPGNVNSNPSGISCSTGNGGTCSAPFNHGTSVTLMSSVSNSTFDGWNLTSCPGTANCVVTMDGPKTITAAFTADPARVKLDGNPARFYSIAAVLDAVGSASSIVRARNQVFSENVVMAVPFDVKLKGAYTTEMFNTTDPSNDTIIDGALKIRNGTLRVEHITIR